MKKIRIRPSSLSEFGSCAWKWYNKFILGKEEFTNSRAAVGTAIHKSAEMFWDECKETGNKDVSFLNLYMGAGLHQLEETLEKEDIKYSGKDDKDVLVKLVTSGVKAYFRDIVPFVNIPSDVELFVSVPVENNPYVYEIGGTCDQYSDKDNIADDIKTSSKTSYFSNHILQLSIYKFLIEKVKKKKLSRFRVQGVTLYKTKEAEGCVIPILTNVDRAVYIIKNLLTTLKVLHSGEVDPKILFRGNTQHHFCNQMFCGNYRTCPFITG